MSQEQREEIAQSLIRARARTLELFDLAREEKDLHVSPGFGFRPLIWHLAHTGVFESYWILQKLKGESAIDERYERIFDPINTPREESKNLPARSEMEAYLQRVRASVLDYLESADFRDNNLLLRDGYIFRMVLEHEYQHQETILYLFQLLDPAKKRRPLNSSLLKNAPASSDANNGMLTIPAGDFVMGAPSEWNIFVYDNERPAHTVHVPAFMIDRKLTTNEEYARFVEEGGYERREWWSDEGWSWREKENWRAPLYWTRATNQSAWRERTMFDEAELAVQHPVTGVSWYEAEAYARFMKKRLPTEAEWERAASWDEGHTGQKRLYSWGDEAPDSLLCNFNCDYWGTTPVGSFTQGASAAGCLDMTGNVWEWTSDAFRGYSGFKAFPYPEYSEVWFDEDHRVLKGGSWATRAPLLRTSFRNFFRRHFRIAFAGIRCAADTA